MSPHGRKRLNPGAASNFRNHRTWLTIFQRVRRPVHDGKDEYELMELKRFACFYCVRNGILNRMA
jgi:hypothetical protein